MTGYSGTGGRSQRTRLRDAANQRTLFGQVGANRLAVMRDRATNIAALYDTLSNPPSPNRLAYDITDVSGSAPPPAPVPAPVPSLPAPGSIPAPPVITSVVPALGVNNVSGYLAAGSGVPGTMVRLYSSPAMQFLGDDAVLAPANTWSIWVPPPPLGQPVQFVATAFYTTDPSQLESAPTPAFPAGSAPPISGGVPGVGGMPVVWLGPVGGATSIPTPTILSITQTAVPGVSTAGVTGWAITGNSVPGTVVRLYAVPPGQSPEPLADSAVVQAPGNSFTFIVAVPPGATPTPIQVTAYSASDPQHQETLPSPPSIPLTSTTPSVGPPAPIVTQAVHRLVPTPMGLAPGIFITGTSVANSVVRAYAAPSGTKQPPVLAESPVQPAGTGFTLQVPLPAGSPPPPLVVVAYFSTDTTQAESASTPVTVSDWGPGGGVWEHYEERQVSYGLLFEIFDELDISGINSGSAMAELRAELGRRGIRMWLPRSVVTHVFEIWCKVDRQFPRDPDDLGRWRVPYGLLFAIFEDLELRELEFGVALRQVREELPRRNLPYELPRRYIIRALRLWRAVQLEMVEELEERLEERVRERIERSEDIEDALRTEDRERKEEEREERGETKPAERQDATVDAIPDIEDGTKHEVIFAVFARIEEMGINIDSPAGGFRGLNDLVNDLLAARGGRRARDVVLNAARARYRQQRRNSPSDS